jgi:transposase-like protein
MSRRYFSREFKLRLLAEVKDGEASMSEVARRHRVRPDLVRRWRAELGAVVGFLPHVPPSAQGPEAELESLRREVAQLRRDNALLKKIARFLETTASDDEQERDAS